MQNHISLILNYINIDKMNSRQFFSTWFSLFYFLRCSETFSINFKEFKRKCYHLCQQFVYQITIKLINDDNCHIFQSLSTVLNGFNLKLPYAFLFLFDLAEIDILDYFILTKYQQGSQDIHLHRQGPCSENIVIS